MKRTAKIFNLQNVNDLPIKLAEQVNSRRLYTCDERILTLFDIKPVLNFTEIMVGLYRAYELQRSRVQLHKALNKMKEMGLLKNPKRGIYEKVNYTKQEI